MENRSNNLIEKNYMLIQTDKPYYEPGDVVNAQIYLRIQSHLYAKFIDLHICGKEKGSFILRNELREKDGKIQQVPIKLKEKR